MGYHGCEQNASYAAHSTNAGDNGEQPHHGADEQPVLSSTSALSQEALRLQRQLYFEVRRPLVACKMLGDIINDTSP